MVLFWRIRYIDTRDRKFKDRDLWLDTEDLDARTRAAVETCHELNQHSTSRGMLKFRHLFREESDPGERRRRVEQRGHMATVSIHDYYEDETGKALTSREYAKVVTGSDTAVLLPAGSKQHDIDYMFAEKKPIDLGILRLTASELEVLGYFARDLQELASSCSDENLTVIGVRCRP
jgi:hypothetical protein